MAYTLPSLVRTFISQISCILPSLPNNANLTFVINYWLLWDFTSFNHLQLMIITVLQNIPY